MIATVVLCSALTAGSIIAAPGVPAAGPGPQRQAAAQVTPAEAAPFVGDWTLALEGPNGPGTFGVSLKTETGKVTGEISSEALGTQPVTSVTKSEQSLVLGYTFMYEGNPVDAAVSLTPGAGGKMSARIDFAGGAYVMTGTALKNEKKPNQQP